MKNFKKLLSVFLICAMLLPSVILPASAVEGIGGEGTSASEFAFENLSDTVNHNARYIKTSGTMTDSSYYPQYFDATSTIAVNPGDKISIGPVPRGYYVHYSLYLYGSDGKIITSGYKRLYAVAEETGTISNNMVIYTYTVPEDGSVTGIRVQLPQRYAYQRVGEENICRVLITRNYQFSGEEYLEYMKAVKGIDVKFIDDVASLADPKTDLANANLFEITKDNAYMSAGAEKSSTKYCYCTIGDTLAAGDVLYFVSSNLAAVNAKNKSVLVDVKYTGGALVEKTEDVIYCEDLGNGLGIFAFIVTEGVEQVSINVLKTPADDVDASVLADPATEMLITKNLRFDKTMYRKFLGYEITEMENLYDADSLVHGFPTSTYGNYVTAVPEENGNWYTAEFEVTPGSSITIGPVFYDVRNYFGFGYPEDNSYKASAKIGQDRSELMVEEETILGRAKIYTYRVRSTAAGDSYDVVKVRLAVPAIFADCTLVTENYAFTAKEYLEYMDAKGVYVDFLKADAGDAANITKNWFDKNDGYDTAKYPYHSDATGTLNTGAVDRARTRVWTVGDGEGQLKVGDVIYFVANDYGNGNSYNLFNMWFDGDERHPYAYLNTKQSNFSSDYESVAMGIEDLGRGFSIYAVRVPEGATQVAVTVPSGLYEDGISLMTVNEPFSGETWKEMFDIEAKLAEEEASRDYNSPLNGLTGLFVGDSISAASHDSKSYLDNPDYWAGWAGGIAASTGMISTNKSNSGAKISYSGKENSDWIWHQQNTVKDQQFDVVVMQGGVNDAGSSSILLGEIRSVDTTIEALRADEVCSTYLGGLQLLFASTKANWPDAELFFIANYKLSGNKATSGQRENLGEWFAQAKILCEMYGVHFIDLYNNEELTTALKIEGDTREYIHDGTHPNMAGYDIITPYIQREIEAVMCDDEHHRFSVADKDAENHFNSCKYCGVIDENSIMDHIYLTPCDDTCSVDGCDVTRIAPHLYDDFGGDETHHWAKCSLCGDEKIDEKVSHDYKTPMYDDNYHWNECDCGVIDEEVAHDYTTPKYNGEYHWNECDCGVIDVEVAHDYVIPKYDGEYHWNECACGVFIEKTAHDYSAQHYDENGHWTECACGERTTAEPHKYDDDVCDESCNACDYAERIVPHDYTVMMNEDDTYHWVECSLCNKEQEGSREEHKYEDGVTCKCGHLKCTDHIFVEFDSDETGHWQICSICGSLSERVGHNYLTHMYDGDYHWNECVCGAFDEKVAHEYTTPKYDGEYHWNECACGAIDEKAAHGYTAPKYDSEYHWNECACGAIDEKVAHDYMAPKYDSEYHWNECACGAFDEKVEHIYTIPDKNAAKHWNKCECGADGEKLNHTYTVPKRDDSYHWKVCSACAEVDVSSVENHSFSYVCDPSCDCGFVRNIVHDLCVPTKDATHHWNACLLCEAAGEKTAHTFGEWTVEGEVQSRACDCGYVESKPVVDDETTVAPDDDGTTAEPDSGTTAEPDDETTAEPGEDETYPEFKPSKGCGSVVTATLGFATLALLTPVALVLRKKEEDEE